MTSRHRWWCSMVIMLALLAGSLAGCAARPASATTAPAVRQPGLGPGVSDADLDSAMKAAGNAGGDPRRTEVLNVALRERGKKYEWGGNGPDTWDCSGLVKHSFAEVGVQLPRVTYDQVKEGREVQRGKYKPADLLFFFHNGHVGLYIGRGLMIHAMGVVKVEKVSKFSHSFSRARRVIQDTDVVVLPGNQWHGVDVYGSDNPHSEPTNYKYGQKWQCVEVVQRLYAQFWGYKPIWPVAYAKQMYDSAPGDIIRHGPAHPSQTIHRHPTTPTRTTPRIEVNDRYLGRGR